jgi:hypothetical protein
VVSSSYASHAAASPPHAGSVKVHPSFLYEQMAISPWHDAGIPLQLPASHWHFTVVHEVESWWLAQGLGKPEHADERYTHPWIVLHSVKGTS